MMPTMPSVFGPHRLVSLLLTPRTYFAHPDLLRDRRGILIAAVLSGFAGAMDRIDQKLVRADLSNQGMGETSTMTSWVLQSWMNYWILVIGAGLIGSVFIWYIRGWWYRKRLEWSGAGDVAPDDARSVAVLQDLVYVLPTILLALIQTATYSNYAEAWEASDVTGMLVLIFVFWSCWTSYCAATTVFTVQKSKARFWFLILPLAFYVVILGVVTMLISMFHH
ncbi:hypothetical protein GTP56_06245 [Duganella sp. FT134W]|uniref:Yip1 domain-containing protein n=1 Tax=Duganella margarita TaxID=2692170 RepID=A0A7X4KGS7_9BURK|nr:hypothetical protein [Duganella margarita]MYM71798.1 hypothetical protein [Duganella margarita]